jgi:hypothetical protein
MAKQSRRRQANRSTIPKTRQTPTSSRSDQKANLAEARATAANPTGAEQAAKAEGIDPDVLDRKSDRTASEPVTDDALLEEFVALRRQRRLYEESRERADHREKEAESARDRADEALRSAETERVKVTADREALDRLQTEVGERFAAVLAREAHVGDLEMEAATGFQSLLAAKERAIEERWKEAYDQRIAVAETAQASTEAEHARQREELMAWRARLDEEQRDLIAETARVQTDDLANRCREETLQREVEALCAVRIQQLEQERHTAVTRSAVAESEITRLANELTSIREKWRGIGDRDPLALLEELELLRGANREMQVELATRLDGDATDRLEHLEDQNRELTEERTRLRYELETERGNAVYDRISHLQVQQLREAQQQFEAISRGYQSRIKQLQECVEGLTEDRRDPGASLFPNCVEIDDDTHLADRGIENDGAVDLHSLSRALQGAMWGQSERNYRLDDVCTFLGGMAMSRLHLLEGMSGIGKTSLPRAVADAFNAHCEIIEVQAGWRDQQDLFGHYNAFEHRFHETRFLTALYKAGTPRHADRPFFIVLDEMNLSRPEQYFSVLLSRLESEDPSPIRLAPSGSGRAPARFELSGTGIAVPDNVWFIGTANQDESTLEFADKTYNRSFILELPASKPWVPRKADVEPFTRQALQRAFEGAKKQHSNATQTVTEVLKELEGSLHDVGRVHVSPRLRAQLERFVPVVVAARGTDPEERRRGVAPAAEADPVAVAADHFIASKVLRQIRNRFEVTTEGIDRMERDLSDCWGAFFSEAPSPHCSRVLDEERRRRSS